MTTQNFSKPDIATEVAGLLLDIEAVHVNTEKPFIFTSGWASPVYIDCRKVISFLEPRRKIIEHAVATLAAECDLSKVDYIAGGETAGISYAAWISEELSKPMLYVRKKPKGFGRGAQIEGEMKDGARVLLVEDLTTDGGSKIAFAEALRDGGAVVSDVFSVFFYGIYKESPALFEDAGLSLHYLATWRDVLAAAKARKLVTDAQFEEVEKFLAAPAEWSRDHGGAFERAKAAG
ncbi:MAG: orotate phosphoribosyltransferase [Alphaproteobacteria bacterium]|nr:orotate phosphoribosyltransferase [Alphaproteobacteria bacterium]